MTELLQKAISEASKLPISEQDAIASIILDEMASEERWRKAFASSANTLEKLANGALEQHHLGNTNPLEPSAL